MTESTKGMTVEEAIRGLTERMKDLFARNYGHSRSDYGMNTESLWPLGEDVLKVCADYEADILSLLKTDRMALAKRLRRNSRAIRIGTDSSNPRGDLETTPYEYVVNGATLRAILSWLELESKSEMR